MRAPAMPVVYLAFALGWRRICGKVMCRKLFSSKVVMTDVWCANLGCDRVQGPL